MIESSFNQTQLNEGRPILLQSRNSLTKLYGFLVGVEIDESSPITSEEVAEKLQGSLTWVEGIGRVDITEMGLIPKFEQKEGE